jgi:hypothetical protein
MLKNLKLLWESLLEGGWDTTATQSTVIRPSTVKIILETVQELLEEKKKLKGKQKKLDVAPPFGKLDKHDFKRLGARSKAKFKKREKLEEAIDDGEIDMAIDDAVEYARFHMATKENVFDKHLLPLVRDNPEREREVRARFYQKLRSEF